MHVKMKGVDYVLLQELELQVIPSKGFLHLVKAEVDAIVIDTAHGHSFGVMDMAKLVKKLTRICN